MRRSIVLLSLPIVALAACGSTGDKAASTTVPVVATSAVATTESTTETSVATLETVAVSEASTTVAATAAPTTVANTEAPTTVEPTTIVTYPPGSNKDDGIVDPAEGEFVRNDLRAHSYTVVPDMFTDERLQKLATESCGRSSEYARLPLFYLGEGPAILNALDMLHSDDFKTIEADRDWMVLALVDATSTACGTEVARILAG